MDLFPNVTGSSPMEEWRQRHRVTLNQTSDGWSARAAGCSTRGPTAEAALLAWSDKAGVKCWKAEELERIAKHGSI